MVADAWATALIRRYLQQQGIVAMGRFGSWRYLSMEQTFLDGQHAAEWVRGNAAMGRAMPAALNTGASS